MSNQGGGSFDWNPAAIEDLKIRWATGTPVRQIAKDMRTTLGTITGKVDRLGLESRAKGNPLGINGRPRTSVNAANAARRRSVRKVELKVPDPYHSLPPDQSPDAVSLFDVKRGQCRYSLNEISPISDFRFCGSAVHDRSLCRRHFRLCYHKTPARRLTPQEKAERRRMVRSRYFANGKYLPDYDFELAEGDGA